jgi:prevent-host-death family protein
MRGKTVGAFDAKTHLASLLDEVEKGAVVTITRHGKPVAELRPVSATKRPQFGAARGKEFRLADDFDEALDDFRDYER